MTDQVHRTAQRHCDVAIVGGSAAGLAAGLQLGRQRRSVIVVDSGEPRNAPSGHMHSYLGWEGVAPTALIDAAREEVRSYGGEVLAGRVTEVKRIGDDRFGVDLVGGNSIVARRVLAATGLVDELPDVEGLAQHWGGDVIHCPFCHGYEIRGQRVVQLVTNPRGLHTAPLFRQLTNRLTVVLMGEVDVDEREIDTLRSGGVNIRRGTVIRVLTGDDGHVVAIDMADGERLGADAIAVSPGFRVRAQPFLALGLRTVPHPTGLGDFVETDATGATSVPGLYAAGNIADPSQQVLSAAADGSRVGAAISFSVAHEDLRSSARPSANQADWDHRYGGEQIWSGNPNGSLVKEVRGISPGRALDVGAGEGGDAMWLAEQGWKTTASDISQRALERIGAEADRRGLRIECQHRDANTLDAFESGAFDLVSAEYASIPRTPDARGVRNLIDAVSPGGTLLVISHDLEPMRQPIDTHSHSQAFDPDAYLRTDDFAAVLATSPDWEIETHGKRPRPGGAVSTHHVDDVVLRARRMQ